MSIVKFEKDGSVHKCKLIRYADHVMEIFLNENIDAAVLTSGFVTLNENNFSVQGNYKNYSTIYQLCDDSDRHYKLSDDGSVYVAPEPIPEQEPYIPTPEEIAQQERQNEIQSLVSQITNLKEQLSSSDYKIIKSYEYSLANKEIEYDMESLHDERQEIRNQINTLEEELQNFLQN